jgi:hypothetical protein
MARSGHERSAKGKWAHRIAWLILIWAGSVSCLAVAAWLARTLMRSVGFA